MIRLTELSENQQYVVDKLYIKEEKQCYGGQAIERLAAYENLYESLLRYQNEISKDLEMLRQANKNKSVKFKELLANKIVNNNLIDLLEKAVLS